MGRIGGEFVPEKDPEFMKDRLKVIICHCTCYAIEIDVLVV